jgi:predicted ATPase
MIIESLKIKNFKVYQNAEVKDLPNLCVFLGANGSGKSTLFDVFGFLSDALKENVTKALDDRGGYAEVHSRDAQGDIEIEIKFRNKAKEPIVTYKLSVGLDKNNRPIVSQEELSYRRGQWGRPYKFLNFQAGKGTAIINEEDFAKDKQDFEDKREEQELESPDILAIKGLGQFQRFKTISAFRRLLENWYVADFTIAKTKNTSSKAVVAAHLSSDGDNLSQVTKYMHDRYPEIFRIVLEKMRQRIPGINSVEAHKTTDNRIVLRFNDSHFKDPFLSQYVSDGTMKMFAYLILLHDPDPHPLVCIEEPENYLHHELLPELAEELRMYANKGGQVFVSSHAPDFVNALALDEVFWLVKTKGYTQIKRASDFANIKALVDAGDKLGELWRQGYFEGSGVKY